MNFYIPKHAEGPLPSTELLKDRHGFLKSLTSDRYVRIFEKLNRPIWKVLVVVVWNIGCGNCSRRMGENAIKRCFQASVESRGPCGNSTKGGIFQQWKLFCVRQDSKVNLYDILDGARFAVMWYAQLSIVTSSPSCCQATITRALAQHTTTTREAIASVAMLDE